MAQSAWKNCSHKLFIVILPFEDPNASNWAFMTYKLYCPPFFFLNFPLWRLFFFLPAMLRSDIEPLPVGVLSCLTPVHIFAVPSPPPPDNELLTEYIIQSCCSVCCCFSIQEKRWIINDNRQKRKRRTKKKSLVFLGMLLSAAAPSRGLQIRPSSVITYLRIYREMLYESHTNRNPYWHLHVGAVGNKGVTNEHVRGKEKSITL